MFSLHHVHLMASDVGATIAFWSEHFGAEVMLELFQPDPARIDPRLAKAGYFASIKRRND